MINTILTKRDVDLIKKSLYYLLYCKELTVADDYKNDIDSLRAALHQMLRNNEQVLKTMSDDYFIEHCNITDDNTKDFLSDRKNKC